MKLRSVLDRPANISPAACRLEFYFDDAKELPVKHGFSGKSGERLLVNGATQKMLIGLGSRTKFDRDALRKAAAEASQDARTRGLRRIAFVLADWPTADATAAAEVVAESARLAQYRYSLASQDTESGPIDTLTVVCRSATQHKLLSEALVHISHVADGVDLARDLSNLPGNLGSPRTVAAAARKLSGQGVRVRILDRAACAKIGMGAFLSVAQGSRQPPAFVVLEYHPARKTNRSLRPSMASRDTPPVHGGRKPLVLVGKGVTFDAGGISLKPAEKMEEMKHDKSGAAAVIGIFAAARKIKPGIPLIGLVPLTENLPGGNASRPGDVVRSLSGKTIEIKNTDAEGRLILADALNYAGRFHPEAIIDMATLTGACSIALGDVYAAILSNNDALARSLVDAGESCGERLWRLPMHDGYERLIKSAVADVQNIPEGRLAGTIIGGMFLKKFLADERTPWAHIDIAATAWDVKGRDGRPAGSTGIGVRLFYEFLKLRGDLS